MKRDITTLAVGLVMLALTMVVAGARENGLPVAPVSALSSQLDCEGNARAQVTLTGNEAKQQY